MMCVVFFKQKTAYEVRISDWSSDVCSSDLDGDGAGNRADRQPDGAAGEQRLWQPLVRRARPATDRAARLDLRARLDHPLCLPGPRARDDPPCARREGARVRTAALLRPARREFRLVAALLRTASGDRKSVV